MLQGGGQVLEFIKRVGVSCSTQRLNLSHMGLRSVPHAVIRLSQLQHLSLSDNPLASVPPSIVRLSNLKSLAIERTRVRSLPVELPGLLELKELMLDADDMLFPPSSVCSEGVHATFQYLRKISGADVVGTLDLSNTGMKEVPVDISHAGGIQRLNLSNNNITRLPPELSLLSSLQSLELEGNNLRPHLQDIVERGLAAIMTYLRALHNAVQTGKLDVSGQGLRFYPDEMHQDWGLTYARLDLNQIRHIPRKIGLLTSLTELSIKDNKLPVLPETLKSLYRLRVLNLDNNELEEVPPSVCLLTGLERLTMRNNALKKVTTSVGKLHNLKELALEGNGDVSSLPVDIALLGNLEALTFDHDSVSMPDPHFHSDFETLMSYFKTLHAASGSRRLDLSNMGLSTMPKDVMLLTGLTVLSLARNTITSLPDDMMLTLTRLEMLDLESNKLEALPESIGHAKGLTCVCALGNLISRIPMSLGLVSDSQMLLEVDPDRIIVPPAEIFKRGISPTLGYLRLLEDARGSGSLQLNAMGLTLLPVEVSELGSLTDLSIASNKLTSLPEYLRGCFSLTRLNVSNNMIDALPPEIASLTALTDLRVEGNPLSSGCPSPQMLSRGLAHVRAFFKKLLECKHNGGLLSLGELANEELNLISTTITSVTSLSLDTAPAFSLHTFQFNYEPDQVSSLKKLHMKQCQLETLPSFVPPLNMLTLLDLSSNAFTSVPFDICFHLTALTELSFDHNLVQEVDPGVSLLTDLTILNLSNNRLKVVPEVLGEYLTNLKELRIAHNDITEVHPTLRECQNTLEHLDLTSNRITVLPPVCLELTRLKSLLLEGNKISQLPLSLGKLVFLDTLTVPTTDLGNVPRDVVLAGGKAIIKYLCGLEDCESSGILDLSHMNLRLLPPTVRSVTSSLTMLKLDDNPLLRLPTWLGEFHKLERISLRNTSLIRLPATLGAIASLTEVVVGEGNSKLESPPPEVVANGGHAVLAYLRRSYSAVLHHQLDLSGFSLKLFPFQVCFLWLFWIACTHTNRQCALSGIVECASCQRVCARVV